MNFEKDKTDVLEEMNLLAEKVRAMQERVKQDNSAVVDELQDIQNRLTELTEVTKQSEAKLNVSTESSSIKTFNTHLDNAITNIFKKENDVCLFEPFLPTRQIPPFVPISERFRHNHSKSTRFVSFINFKGGVGKTTLTANLAAAFATGNYHDSSNTGKSPNLRVLIVDLDFQGTLTDRCAEFRPLINATNEGKTAAELLTNPSYSPLQLENLTIKVEKLDSASIIPAGEKLDFTDNQHFIKLAFRRRDIRYCYRLWFHQPQVFEDYDLVLFDCPPRKTASSICALSASDYVFIPTAPESFDVNSVSRTLNWLILFRRKMNIPLKIGGIIFNRTQFQNSFSPSEAMFAKKLLNSLQNDYSNSIPEIKEGYVQEIGLPTIFHSYIPKRQGAKSINGERGDLLPGAFEKRKDFPFFTDVATEMYERIYQ